MALDTASTPTRVPDAATNGPAAATAKKRLARLYAAIWRWHFIAGLLVTPILFVVSLAGAIYVFRDELEPMLYPELFVVAPQAQMLSYGELVAAAEVAYPNAHAEYIFQHRDPAHSLGIHMHLSETEDLTAYINQYTGQVLGMQDHSSFFDWILTLHRSLFAGLFGRLVVELMVGWSISSVLTGLYLWWRRSSGKPGRWWVRWAGKPRAILRELHSVLGAYFAIVAVVIMATGLIFTYAAGTLMLGSLALSGQLPASYISAPRSAAAAADATPLTIDQAVDRYQATGNAAEWSLFIPEKPEQAFSFTTSSSHDLPNMRMAWVDQYNGTILDDLRWNMLGLPAKAALYFYPIHTGAIYGWPTKIIAVLTCLILIGLSVSGVLLWWWRRPKGKLGVPGRVNEQVVPKWMVALIVVLSIFMPLMGVSLLLVLFGDWAWRRWQRSRNNQPA
ncbi:PepSY-associated TM helix domain-containing protein [Herpetosiphon llansteffanensis]